MFNIKKFCVNLFFLIFATTITSEALGVAELEDCGDHLLDRCVDNLPGPKQFGIPRNQIMLDRHCNQYHFGMGCMDRWMERCMAGDQQMVMRARTAGVRSLMALMCNSTAFRKEYLKEEACWSAVSADLSRCIDALHERTSTEYRDEHAQLCCESEEFDRCVVSATRVRCSPAAAAMLRRMARLALSGDLGACAPRQLAYCAASTPPVAAAAVIAAAASALLTAGQT